MSGLITGLSVFASCDKAWSIPHFTRHLQSYPNDFEALMWRGRARSLVGQTEYALDDFRRAETYSVGPQSYLAESLRTLTEGNGPKSIEALANAVTAYPKCGEVRSEIGFRQFVAMNYNDALQTLTQAIDLGKQNSETQRPWFYWSNQHVGDIFYAKHQVLNAEPYYNTAITSCNTFTIAHLGMSKCSIIIKNITEAKIRFQTAKDLNPNLVHWRNFAEFEQDVVSDFYKLTTKPVQWDFEEDVVLDFYKWVTSTGQRYHGEANSSLESLFSSFSFSDNPAMTSAMDDSDSSRADGRKGGRNNGNGGGNRDKKENGEGSDGKNTDDDYVWKMLKTTPTVYKRHKDGRKFTKIGDSKYWLSRDKAGHGGSFFKVFEETGNTMDFLGSVRKRIFHEEIINELSELKQVLKSPDKKNFNFISKQESHKGEKIKMKDLNK